MTRLKPIGRRATLRIRADYPDYSVLMRSADLPLRDRPHLWVTPAEGMAFEGVLVAVTTRLPEGWSECVFAEVADVKEGT